jgi:transglutaminase-like putative cysteine protease
VPEWLHRLARPREGWLSLFLLFVMLLSVGWAIQSAHWIEKADFLVPVAMWGMLAGAALALLPLSVLATIPFGALLGTGVVLWTVGGEYFPALGQLARLFALRDDSIRWARTISQGGFAPEMTPYAIGLAVIMWSVAFIAAYTLYRHHRVLDAIVLVGVALIANLSATLADLFGYLVLFSLAALLLWLRAALITREEGWQLRRVNENVEVPISIMRSGLVFIAGSIALAWILTTVAVAAPLTAAWRNMDVVWNGVRDRLDGVFGSLTNPESRIAGTDFGAGLTVSGTWNSSDAPIMTVAAKGAYYLRTVTYDVYTGHGWARSDGEERTVEAGDRIFAGYTPERPLTEEGFKRETITVQLQGDVGRNIFVPGYPTVIFAPVVIHESSGQPVLGGIDSASAIQPGQAYQVTALISGVSEAQLASAGSDYPAEIRATYLATPGLTTEVAALAEQLAGAAAADDPYHRAKAIADYLRTDPSFHYATSVGAPDPNRDLVDQFLFGPNRRVGYCEHYASAMVLMARSLGIPARLAVGYAPGELASKDVYQYRAANAHAWAELYFPGYGWQTFEATKSIDPVVRARGEGTPVIPKPVGGVDVGKQIDEGTGDVNSFSSFEPIAGGRIVDERGNAVPTDDAARGGNLLVLGVIGLGGLVLIWTRMRRRRQSMRFLTPGDRQWMRLAWAGDRAGVSQTPAETYYEYAGWLQDQLPARRGEIRTIADGKVWQAYSGRSLNPTMIERIESAWQRLRGPLLVLAVRRRISAILPKRRR